MSRVKSLSLAGIVLLILLGCVLFGNSRALTTPINQSPQGDNAQPMQALLSEVHQLRLAIQRSNLNTYHAQVTLERFRLQQQRVDRLSERLEKVLAEIAEIKSHQAGALEDFQQVQDELAKETDPSKRRYLEDLQQHTKEKLKRLIHMQEQEAQLIAQLQMEQIKLNELNERLDTLQKEMEVVEKPLPSGKRQ